MSGLSRSSQSQSCASRARMPLTFQVATFIVPCTLQIVRRRLWNGARGPAKLPREPARRASATRSIGDLGKRDGQRGAAERLHQLRVLRVEVAELVEDGGIGPFGVIREILHLLRRYP